MSAVDLVKELIAAGVTFETDGERVKWTAKAGLVTALALAELAAQKPVVIDFLTRQKIVPFPTVKRDTYPHSRSALGSPTTWTGLPVTLAAWQALSDWDRHGSTGKVWNGLTRAWEPMKAEAEAQRIIRAAGDVV